MTQYVSSLFRHDKASENGKMFTENVRE